MLIIKMLVISNALNGFIDAVFVDKERMCAYILKECISDNYSVYSAHVFDLLWLVPNKKPSYVCPFVLSYIAWINEYRT